MDKEQELNNLIAEKVFGYTVIHKTWNKGKCHSYTLGEPDYYDEAGETKLFNEVPNYSTDIKAAFEVVDKLRDSWKRVFSLATVAHMSKNPTLEWVAQWELHDPDYRFVFAMNESACVAICKASLKAIENKETE